MKQETLQLTGGAGKSKRRELDYYPTPKEVTIALMDFLNMPIGSVIWEPACGEYAMSKVIESYGHKVISTDIMYGDDYLKTTNSCQAIITNPPFEQAEQFIRKSVKEAQLVAMLLKSQYWHAAKRFHLFKECPPAYVLPLTWRPDFLEHERENGKKGAPTMEVMWTVWETTCQHETIYKPLSKPIVF